MNDDELIAAVAGGDDAALRALFSRHAPWLAARLRAVLPAAEVEDALQETFLAVWQGARGYSPARPASSAGGWLWGIARRQAALLLRRRGPAAAVLPAALAASCQQASDPAETALARADLDRAVAAMGPAGGPEREVWRLLYLEDRPVAEVALLTGSARRAQSRAAPAGPGGGCGRRCAAQRRKEIRDEQHRDGPARCRPGLRLARRSGAGMAPGAGSGRAGGRVDAALAGPGQGADDHAVAAAWVADRDRRGTGRRGTGDAGHRDSVRAAARPGRRGGRHRVRLRARHRPGLGAVAEHGGERPDGAARAGTGWCSG